MQIDDKFRYESGVFEPYKIYSRYSTDKKNKNFDSVKIANIEDTEEYQH